MNDIDESENRKPSFGGIKFGQRKTFTTSQESLVKTRALSPGATLPLVVEPAIEGVSLGAWAPANRDWIDSTILEHGGILFRGFHVTDVADFEQLMQSVSSGLLPYTERSSPRTSLTGNIYTSTEYPADQSIFLHNENSYQKTWPLRISFFCVIPSETGGETPIADCRRVLDRIPAGLRDRFERHGVMYVRNFDGNLGLSWQTVFQTDDRNEVEAYCHNAGISTEWKTNGCLRTRQVRSAVAQHPKTGEMVWFNHGAFFHISTLDSTVQKALLSDLKLDELPNNTFYGDGSEIEPSDLDEIRSAYSAETVKFTWQSGDVLLLDNMLVAHGRAPFTGVRKIAVAMAEPCSLPPM